MLDQIYLEIQDLFDGQMLVSGQRRERKQCLVGEYL